MLSRKELTEWTTALRANPEQQIFGALTNNGIDGFCCLGKLCQIQGLTAEKLNSYQSVGYGYSGEKSYLPREVITKFGSRTGNFEELKMPDLINNDYTWKSASMANDNDVTWLEIADHFDKYYPCSDEVVK
jgi:hypothetical protein